MKNITVRFLSILAVLSLLVSFGCKSSTTTTATKATTATTATTVAPEVRGITKDSIKIGIHSGMTGTAASMSYDALKGLQTAAFVVNDSGGIYGRRIDIVWEDDKYDPAQATAVAKRMAEVNKVFAVVGNVGTSSGVASSKAYEELKVPFVAPAGYSIMLHQPVKKYTYMLSPYWGVSFTMVVDYLLEKEGLSNVGMIWQNDEAGQEGSAAVNKELTAKGKPTLVASAPFTQGALDFSSQVLAMQKAGAKFVFIQAPQPAVAAILKEAQKLGYAPKWYGTTATGDPVVVQLAGKELAEGVRAFVFNPSPDETTPGMLDLKQKTAKYFPGYAPGFAFFNGYAGMLVAIEGLKKAGPNVTTDSFLAALDSIKNFDTQGLFGPISFSPTNHSGHNFVKFVECRNGQWTVLGDWIGVK